MALLLHIEGKRGAEVMLCFFHLEVGHIHSAAFVTSDSPINHVRGSVNAQWLCSAGGLSLWMPGLQPRCSTPVLPPLSFSPYPSVLWHAEMTPFSCPLCTSDSHLFLFPTPSPYFPALGTFHKILSPALTFQLKSEHSTVHPLFSVFLRIFSSQVMALVFNSHILCSSFNEGLLRFV